MKAKRLFFGASLVLLGFAATSCGGETKTRNTVTPYGSLNDKLNTVVATANNDKYSLDLDTYYSRLKYKGYTTFTNALNKQLYADYLKAATTLYNNKTLASITDADEKANLIKAYTLVDKDANDKDVALYELTEEKYTELRRDLLTSINRQVQSKTLSVTTAEALLKKTDKEIAIALAKFVDTQSRSGYPINANDIKWITKDDAAYELSEYADLVQFDYASIAKMPNILDEMLFTEAQTQATKYELYKIADEEYIKEENEDGEEDEVKNTNYLFKDEQIESGYDKSFKTFGTYNAVIITFNSRREALNAISKTGDISQTDAQSALDTYLDIYEEYYSYKVTSASATDPEFFYTVDKEHDDFADLTAEISSLLKDTLEVGQYLTEPRNINNKYVLAYKIGVEYEYHKDGDTSKQLDYEDLTDARKKEMEATIKENLIKSNYTAYRTTLYNKLIEESELKIFDPYFEYKFEYANTDYYDPIETVTSASSNLLFESKYGKYTVEEFFKEASTLYASGIISEYFQLEYAYEYIDKYIEEEIIADDSKDTNKENLDKAIDAFKNGTNATYPKEIGLETYLLASYGYNNKDDVLKYHYSATNALAQYKNKVLFDEWAKEVKDGENTTYVISDEATNGFLANILATGNNNYSELFKINLDHILINIDDNADGTPDDPQDFLSKNPTVKAEFEAAVEKLAKALYLEAINPAYKDNTLYETLKYIKVQYEEGAELLSNPGHTWDEYKTFNFLLTVEQLASSADIDQSSVNNFVVPFKEYVENVYKTAVENKVSKEFDNGTFYFVSTDAATNEVTGSIASTEADASLVTFDSLCATNYGYHMLVLNSYDSPVATNFTQDDDTSESQKELQIVIRKYLNDEDDEDDDTNVYVVTDSYNEETNKASFNQFFIYYVQSTNGASSVLDSDIQALLASLFGDAITTYKSTNFQTFLLLDSLDIKIKDVTIADYKLDTNAVNYEKTYYANQVISYKADSDYASWIDGSLSWTRPDLLK